MKITLFCIGIFLGNTFEGWAQKDEIIRVKAGQIPAIAIAVNERYQYPEFLSGTITYMNGNQAAGKFNYNLLLGEMHFIGPSRDTLAIANEQMIKLIQIAENLYFYNPDHGYIEVIVNYGSMKLGIRKMLRIMDSEKTGGYDQSSGVSSIKNYNSYAGSNSQLYKLQSKADVLFTRDNAYFIIDQNNYSHIASRGNFMKVFAKHKKEIGSYLKENPIKFNKEDDLKKLLQFCAELQ